MNILHKLASELKQKPRLRSEGKIISSKNSILIASIPNAAIGDFCVLTQRDNTKFLAIVIGFEKELCFLAPYDEIDGVSTNTHIECLQKPLSIVVGDHLIGKMIDPLGQVISAAEGISPLTNSFRAELSLKGKKINPTSRLALNIQMRTGIPAIDLFMPIAFGQRLGLFAGPGAGKSTLLGMICRNSDFDVAVIGLIGERGREISEFIHSSLGPKALNKSIIIASTSDESSMRRFLAIQSATAIAEHYRSQGKRVLLLIDSLTRAARALRDITLAAGELPIRQGFTPSVYAELPRLLERAGNSEKGSITAIYTVLTQNDEANDALGEEVKSLLDGHIVLSNKIAQLGLRPAIDIAASISRVSSNLMSEEEQRISLKIKSVLNRIINDKEILLLGGQPDSHLAAALALESKLFALISQDKSISIKLDQAQSKLREIYDEYLKTCEN